MMTPALTDQEKGFTLIEIILAMVVASVLFTMMFTYFNRSLMDSALPIIRLQQSMALTRAAERITAHYYSQDRSREVLTDIRDNLEDATKHPYGNDFEVKTNQFITFAGGYNDKRLKNGPEKDTQAILKITIQSKRTNETITLLLAQW